MPIHITRAGHQTYTASVTASKHSDVAWEASQPMELQALIDALLGFGLHQQDIGDAFYEADPDWLSR
jgi:NAD(P)H-hydrate repair Nnr-like enzyme with NAD(P)H-hydrate epimerase domain